MALLLVIVLAAPLCLQAQVLYGTIVGTVTDSSGSAIPGAAVTATEVSTNIKYEAKTDYAGIYRFTDLRTGTYRVSVSANQFAASIANDILVRSNQETRVDRTLSPATVTTSVTVTSAPPALQTDSAAVTSELESKQLETVIATPGVGMRNFQSLYMVLPGFTPPATDHSEAGNPSDTLFVNANGVSGSNNDTRIDGVSDIYPWLPEIAAYTPSIEAISNVNVVTNSFNADQGFASGASINVTTKSGTNRYHGSVWEYNTISALQAKGYYVPSTTRIPKYILNQFGANLGAPIKKNKAFYFVNWERERRSQAVSGFQTLPTANMLAGIFPTGTSDSRLIYDPATGAANGSGRSVFLNNTIPSNRFSYAAQQMIKLLQPLVSKEIATPTLSNNYFVALDTQYTRDNIDSRFDVNPSQKSTLFVRYGIQKTSLTDAQPLGAAGGNTLDGGQPGNSPSIIQSIGIGATYTFTPNLLLDGNIGYTRQGMSGRNTDLGTDFGLTVFKIPGTNGPTYLQSGMPAFNLSNLSSYGNPNRSNPFQFRDNTYTGGINLTWNKGKHSIRTGAELQHYALNHFQPQNTVGPRGGFSFNGGATALPGSVSPDAYNAWADFLLGLPQTTQKDTQFLNPATMRENVWAVYIRDQWQASRKLTINYGLRYEIYPLATRDHTGLEIFNPNDGYVYIGGVNGIPTNAGVNTGRGILGPRLGVAYRIDEKTVMRGGFGLSANPDNYRNVITSYPTVLSQTYSGCNSYIPSGYLNAGEPTTLPSGVPQSGCPDNSTLPVGIPTLSEPDLSSGKIPLPHNVGATTLPLDYRRGYYETFNLAVERQLPGEITLNTAYVGDVIIREVPGININTSAPGTGTGGEVLNQKFGIIAGVGSEIPMGTGNYNGLQVSVKRRFAHGDSVGLNYTYSKSINDYGDQSDGSSGLRVAYLPDYFKNRGPSGFDRTHNLQIFGNYEVPVGKGRTYLATGQLGYILGGWELAGSLSRESGTPFTVSASSNSLNSAGSSQFADQLVSHVQILGGHDAKHPYFNTADFADPALTVKSLSQDRFGTANANSVRGPGFFNLSLSLARAFAITEHANLTFRAESFNVTNTPSFSNPASNVSSPSSFGIISGTQSTPRSVRLSARVDF